jgi:hypothetical protein
MEPVAKRNASVPVRGSGVRAEKIGRDRLTFQKGGRGQSAGNAKQAGALREKGNAEPLEGIP